MNGHAGDKTYLIAAGHCLDDHQNFEGWPQVELEISQSHQSLDATQLSRVNFLGQIGAGGV